MLWDTMRVSEEMDIILSPWVTMPVRTVKEMVLLLSVLLLRNLAKVCMRFHSGILRVLQGKVALVSPSVTMPVPTIKVLILLLWDISRDILDRVGIPLPSDITLRLRVNPLTVLL